MVTFKLSFAYFGVIFAAGFVLGVIRTLWLVPILGERDAELTEIPVMLGLIVLTSRSLVNRWRERLSARRTLAGGAMALVLLLIVEFSVVLYARGLTVAEYFAARNPVAGFAYALSLVAFALMPWWVFARTKSGCS